MGVLVVMPGRPQLQQLAKHIEEHGGEDWVFSFVAEGLSMKKVAERVGATSRGMLYLWLDLDRENRRRKLEAARQQSADAHAEDGLDILDELDDSLMVTPAEVSAANSRANYRKWLASVRNREAYGDRPQVDVNVNIKTLHLDALRKYANATTVGEGDAPPALGAAPEDVVDADYEVVDQDGGEDEELAALMG